MNEHRFKNTGIKESIHIKEHRNSGIQRHKNADTWMQGCMDTHGLQEYRDTRIQGCRDEGMQGCRDAGMQRCRDAGMQGC